MQRKFYVTLLLAVLPFSSFHPTEILLKTGDAFLVGDISESPTDISFSWKDEKYKIPRSDIQRIDPRKKGTDSSYRYSEFQLSDGTVLRGIVIEKKDTKIILKTELGFVELDKSKISSKNFEEISDSPPLLSEKYLDNRVQNRDWRVGLSLSGLSSLGIWSQSYPITYGGGLFLERNATSPLWFYGFSSELTYGRGKVGSLSVFSQAFYFGKSYGNSSPYWLLGVGASSISRSDSEERSSAITPDTIFEFGWSWETKSQHLLRLGIRSQCNVEFESSLCRTGIRFSWGFSL
ncbi:hypothetical protein EHQ81_12045 [Leptospira selangorensis]|uniref:30S ribosomal protein S1 n=1 Tax=Leptospira selangorensis TaxID=2484982 RepID=A0A5F2C1X6_9LEPT|nr:hypothetical protein [Leptospira selangorensis]TGM12979.1 hypothetical protein EHQ81_12045 [Leptospira selangorensis]TGM21270.1 hypothetical protein EHQ82_09705 [Leptospira selangorensis]